MDVSTILNFNGLFQAGHKSPEFSLNIVFGNGSRAIEDGIEWHLILKVAFLEIGGLLLELLQGINSTFLESKLAIANETPRAVPVIVWLMGDGRIEAVHMIAVIT